MATKHGKKKPSKKVSASEFRPSHPFKEHFDKWRLALKDSAVGPLLIAEDVMKHEAAWIPKENGGRSYSGALEDVLGDGKGRRFFNIRALAAKALAPFRAARMFEHTAAVWLTAKATNGALEEAVKRCAIAFNHNHQCPLTTPQVFRVTKEVLGYRPKQRIASYIDKDLEIERLKQMLADREHEIEELKARLDVKEGAKAVRLE